VNGRSVSPGWSGQWIPDVAGRLVQRPLRHSGEAWVLTRVETGRPGSRALANFQLASRSPVTKLAVRIDGVLQPDPIDGDARNAGSVWFRVPPSGTHSLTLEAANKYGCVIQRTAPPLIVP